MNTLVCIQEINDFSPSSAASRVANSILTSSGNHTGFPDIKAADLVQLKFPNNMIPDDLFDMMEMLDA